MKKIHIIGATGSGKSYIAKELSKRLNIPYYELDNIVWDITRPGHQLPKEERDLKIQMIVNDSSWILEGVYHKFLMQSFKNADVIVVLTPNVLLRDFRIVKRFIKRKLGFESSNYTQNIKNLIDMLKWNHKYERVNINEILCFIKDFSNKTIILKDNRQVYNYLNSGLN